MPENEDEFTTLASKTLAKILVAKLNPIEVKKLIEILSNDKRRFHQNKK